MKTSTLHAIATGMRFEIDALRAAIEANCTPEEEAEIRHQARRMKFELCKAATNHKPATKEE